jgi:hypothetical protein
MEQVVAELLHKDEQEKNVEHICITMEQICSRGGK